MAEISLISIGTWIGTKLAEKGFEGAYHKITADKSLNEKFYAAVSKVSRELQKKYLGVLGDNIEYFFKKEEIYSNCYSGVRRSILKKSQRY
jgi:hypothetical protein